MKKSRAFWKQSKSAVTINDYLLRKFLLDVGFGQFQVNDKRTSDKSFFKDDNGILKVYDEVSIKSWIRNYFENTADDEFKNGNVFGHIGSDEFQCGKDDMLSKFQSYSTSKLKSSILKDLEIYSEKGFPDTKKLRLFNDKRNVAHIIFKNGVVRITKDSIKMLPMSELKGKGSIWESSIIDKDIKYDDSKGLFEKFCENAMKYKNPDKNHDDWRKNYDLRKDHYLGMRTGYGFMIHTHNTPDVSKCVYHIDADAEPDKPNGGNGKSLVMKSVKHYKPLVEVAGDRFRQNMEEGGRFQFSNVDVDTKFVCIDDVIPTFKFQTLFSFITGEMEIERKGKDIMMIPADRKPKFGVTTNYVVPGVGTSHRRRQHVVEFGNYWNFMNEIGESVSDKRHIGKDLLEEWTMTKKDWNQFYSYGFRCVQEYFQKGLVESPNNTYAKKLLNLTIEGVGGSGEVTRWMEDWCKKERLEKNYHFDGISELKLYKKFISENNELDPAIWDVKKFRESFWTFIDMKPEYDYNPDNAKKGRTLTDRRWLKGSAGSQERWYKITDVKIKTVDKTTME